MKRVDSKLSKNLGSSPLTDFQRAIMQRVYVDGETVTQVAKELGMSKSTISYHLKRSRKILDEWSKLREYAKRLDPEKIEERIAALEKRMNEYRPYLDGLMVMVVEVGKERLENCQFARGCECEKKGWTTNETLCTLCMDYVRKRLEE